MFAEIHKLYGTFTKWKVIYVKNTPPPTTTVKPDDQDVCSWDNSPLIQPFKKPQETISSSTRIYKQSLLNSFKKETDAMLTHKHLKKSERLKIEQHWPIDQKLLKRFF